MAVRLGFWRGMIAGSIMGALIGMLMPQQRKPERKGIFRIARTNRPGFRTNRMIRRVTSRVAEIIR